MAIVMLVNTCFKKSITRRLPNWVLGARMTESAIRSDFDPAKNRDQVPKCHNKQSCGPKLGATKYSESAMHNIVRPGAGSLCRKRSCCAIKPAEIECTLGENRHSDYSTPGRDRHATWQAKDHVQDSA